MQKTTIRASRSSASHDVAHPPGLLLFYPLGPGRTMRYVALRSEKITLGRSEESDVHIDDGEASRLHALLDRSKRYWQLIDHDSTNGVFLNGERVDSSPLAGGEVIRIGGTFLRFFLRGLAATSRLFVARPGPIITGPAFDEFWELLERAARSDLSVLVHGETGTGKELIASYLHDSGDRRGGPFVPVNCAAIPREIFESELFGHVKGAFTGAAADKQGLIRQASGGTLFLDEVGELPLESQAKLLRCLQEREVWPVGAARSFKVDIRLVCASNRNLERLALTDGFRADLYARLADLEIHLPPLRKRLEDIPLLADHFLAKHGGARSYAIAAKAMDHLVTHPWPYNIRELESSIRRAMLFAGDASLLELEHFASKVAKPEFLPDTLAPVRSSSTSAPAEALPLSGSDEVQADELRTSLLRHDGDVNRTAAELGISRSQLYRRAKKLGLDVAAFRSKP